MENENKYQITKTIRFKLNPQQSETDKILSISSDNNFETENDLTPLIDQLKELNKMLQNLLYAKEKNGGYKTTDNVKIESWNKIKIKYTWMRTYMKTVFYENKREDSPKQYNLTDLDYVQTEFVERWFPEFDGIIEELKDFEKRNSEIQYEKQRYAQAALILNKLIKRNNFEFIKAFIYALCATNIPETDKEIDKLKKAIDKLDLELNKQKAFYLPFQSNGLQVAAGSFNYYTINKSPKMLDSQKRASEEKLKACIYQSKGFYNAQERKVKDRGIVGLLGLTTDLSTKSLDDAYFFLKKWKADQKKQFMEAIQAEDDRKAKSIKLFESSEDDFDKIKKRILSIQKIAKELNTDGISSVRKTELKEKLKKIKSEKNEFFNTFLKPEKAQTNNYKQLCDFYKSIALKRGKIITKIAAIEKEKNIAEQVKYWCFILEQNKRQFIYMIPRNENDNLKNAKDYLDKLKNAESNDTTKLYYFKSLTLRALRKLCFKEVNNTFRDTLSKNSVTFPQYEQEWNNMEDGEKRKVKFYQSVLKNASTLDLASYQGIEKLYNSEFDSLNDFESELNKICYVKKLCISDEITKRLKEEFNAISFEITSQDIEHKFNSEGTADSHKNKNHTELWNSFWKQENERNKYPIRLNPEIKIMWRDAKPSRVHKYGDESTLYDKNKKNRYLHQQYTLITTITQNAHDSEINFAFADTKDKGEAIIDFNNKINVNAIKYSLGIDVGTDDLAVCTLINNNNEPVSFDVYKIKEKKLDFSKTGYFKSGEQREKPYKLLENPSYFLNKELYEKTFKCDDFDNMFGELFEKQEVCSIDLTTAKLISGKIIVNGDFTTHQNLKILNAKRKISQYLKNNPTLRIDVCSNDSYKICLKDSSKETGNETKIYDSKSIYSHVKPYEAIKTELFDFFKGKKLDNARLDDNINKTRASLVGNMIGVISHIYKQYSCFIVLEDLKQSIIESHRKSFEGDISRPLEWALYRKFQTNGLVPPISELVKLRENEKFAKADSNKSDTLHQFGIIKLVDEGGTSLICPKCEKKAYPKSDDDKYKKDKNNKIFECKECGFNNKTNADKYVSLDTNDKIAAFNIAKRGFENFINNHNQ